MRCPACKSELPPEARECSACGTRLPAASVLSLHELEHAPERVSAEAGTSPLRPPSSARDLGRFRAGAEIAGRYRIIALAGRGGMGEVYRAEDLRLEQVVALKFLPQAASLDPELRARLLEEVRLARAVTHPAVCRVHDVGEAEGQLFLSMEFIDGEDLAALQRRIGRLPDDKALEIARALCAGLAAAHARGILHRDLKPANVMLDGRGEVRITDFGLAVTSTSAEHGLAGTPAYMAPEQLDGRPATVQSDLYALGLVLYELFTARSAFPLEAALAEQRRLRVARAWQPPTSLNPGLDPAVERVLERCLEHDPARRPRSAHAVIAGLPGGDPLAAALAAGETPTPEMVAAAGGSGALRPLHAWLVLAATLVVGGLLLARRAGDVLVGKGSLPLAPEVLAHRARELVLGFGLGEQPGDEAYGLVSSSSYASWIETTDDSLARWARLDVDLPASILFWYRRSPGRLDPKSLTGEVSFSDPPNSDPGMALVMLSRHGTLVSYSSVPGNWSSAGPAPATDWSLLFGATGLERSAFEEVGPRRVPVHAYDERRAWNGRYPEVPELPLRIEAAAFEGKLVSAALLGPWSLPQDEATGATATQATEPSAFTRLAGVLGELIEMIVVLGSFLAGYRSLRRSPNDRRFDARGATRVASFFLALGCLGWILGAHHVAHVGYEVTGFFQSLRNVLFLSAIAWLVYMAFEPYARRIWPDALVAWSRLLAGQWRDPMVAREVLVGACLGTLIAATDPLARWIAAASGRPPTRPASTSLGALLGPAHVLAELTNGVARSMLFAFGAVFLLVVFRWMFRKRALALLFFLLVAGTTTPFFAPTGMLTTELLQRALAMLALGWVIWRHGILALAVGSLWLSLWTLFPLDTRWSSWSSKPTLLFLCLGTGMLFLAARQACAAGVSTRASS